MNWIGKFRNQFLRRRATKRATERYNRIRRTVYETLGKEFKP